MSSTLKYAAWLVLLAAALSLGGVSWRSVKTEILSYTHARVHTYDNGDDWGAPY